MKHCINNLCLFNVIIIKLSIIISLLFTGRGSVLNEAGEVETHAFVMRGDTCDIGGVLCLKHVKNPVKAARIVLDKVSCFNLNLQTLVLEIFKVNNFCRLHNFLVLVKLMSF